ncbi:MAG: CDP-alcohol phosphatidyltransferase family protein [Acidimicrobiia bacterium]
MGPNRVLTVPNLVSLLRLLTVPVFGWLLVGERRVTEAAILLLVIGGTDWVDGYLARRLGQVSELGKFLDPFADRMAIAVALVGGLVVGVIPAVLGWALVAREVVVTVGALALVARGAGKLEVRFLGKLATFLLYGAIPSFYLAATGVWPALLGAAGWVAGVLGTILYWVTAGQYAQEAARLLRHAGNVPPSHEKG